MNYVKAAWIVLLMSGAMLDASAICGAQTLSDDEVHAIIVEQRQGRTDLPPPYENGRWKVHTEGCFYYYTEMEVPETPGRFRVFVLNRDGLIVDVISAGR